MQTAGEAAGEAVAAAFVAKTYRMVSDPASDAVIAWGRENNSFVVLDPFAFSQTLLPCCFKHSNFSSFVRQLNAYGFRKVDPDRWEFGHASFLRGRTNLLRHIVRRKKGKGEEEDGEAVAVAVAAELVTLKREQKAIGERADRVWRRLQEAERGPRQMLSFLAKLVGDPQMIGRLMEKGGVGERGIIEWEKRPRVCLEAGPPPALIPAAEAATAAGFFGLEGFGGAEGSVVGVEPVGFGSVL